MPSESSTDGKARMSDLRNPENYEFGVTPHGEKIHIVGTGLPPSMLVLGGDYPEDAEKALCGTVAEFDMDVEPPEDVNGVIDHVCTHCNRQANYIRNRGKFEEVPL